MFCLCFCGISVRVIFVDKYIECFFYIKKDADRNYLLRGIGNSFLLLTLMRNVFCDRCKILKYNYKLKI